LFKLTIAVQARQLFEKASERGLFGSAVLVVDLRGISSVEGNPEKDKLAVWIFGLLGALKPTQRAVHTQAEVRVVVFPLSSMTML
jgi:hypothetical protein